MAGKQPFKPDGTTMQTRQRRRRSWWQFKTQAEPMDELAKKSNNSELFPRIDTMQALKQLQTTDHPQQRNSSSSSSSSLETIPSRNGEQEKVVVLEKKQSLSTITSSSATPVEAYYVNREMTLTQERINALTMIPSPLYCIYYLVSGIWFNQAVIVETGKNVSQPSSFGTPFNALFADEHGCIHSSWFPNLHALPPLPLIMVALAIVLHAPFSFVYHWTYAYPLGQGRIHHWSRRMDQAMIHVASAFISFGTSGSWDYFLVNLAFDLDCAYRLFVGKINPRRSQIRIGISVVAYTIPLLLKEVFLFVKVWTVMGLAFWIFLKYPFGGWSHSVFHIVTALAVPFFMEAALDTTASLDQFRVATACATVRL